MVWEWIKGLFSGKGTTQIGSRNKSASGITVGDNGGPIVVGDNNVVHVSKPAPERPSVSQNVPQVHVGPALANHPFHGIIHFLCITIRNTTEKSLFIGNFLLQMTNGYNAFCPFDSITQEPQQKRELRSGDKFTFHIDVKTLHEIGKPATDYNCALVEDAVGAAYASDSNELQRTIAELLQEKQ